MVLVNNLENDYTERNQILAIGITPVLVSRQPASGIRKNITITNTSAAAQKITIKKGIGLAVAGEGIVLGSYGIYSDATINENARCYQGTFYAISDLAAGQISISEEFE